MKELLCKNKIKDCKIYRCNRISCNYYSYIFSFDIFVQGKSI